MKLRWLFFLFLLIGRVHTAQALLPAQLELYEGKNVAEICISVENLPRGASFDEKRMVEGLRTKVGDPFSQLIFDQDLKLLSQQYESAIPTVESCQGELKIKIQLWQRPQIRSITWIGNERVKTSTLQKELGVRPYTLLNREELSKGFLKVKEYYVKKGYFDAQLDYQVIPDRAVNEVDIEIQVHEGCAGHIKSISFTGLTKGEESAILDLMVTKKYNVFLSWMTGTGNYHEEAIEHDKLVIVNYLQNQGYADAQVSIQLKEGAEGRLEIQIDAVKGELFRFEEITVTGNTLFSDEEVRRVFLIREEKLFSPDQLRETIQCIKELYGKEGYIETEASYTLSLSRALPLYNVKIHITEGEQFRIGMIRVLGNRSTNKNVILRESLLVPGELFDTRRLKVTQQRLEAIGYFKCVNVYPVKTPEDEELGQNYRDVIIEVEETTTGSANFFFGFSTAENVFGGLEMTENNFNHRGLTSWWREGMSAFRGAGEFARLRAQLGKKQQSYTLIWMDPYFRDSSWRFGFETTYAKSYLQSDDYHVNTFGGALFGGRPLTSYWSYGWKLRARNANIHIDNINNQKAQQEKENSGIIVGLSNSMIYDSIDNPFRPHRGLNLTFDVEIAGDWRHGSAPDFFPFFKVVQSTRYYYPVWKKGTLKFVADFRFLFPFGAGSPNYFPLSERFFLGGDSTVRGYKPFILGPHFTNNQGQEKEDDPTGGVSSALLSFEYNQEIFKMLDLFTFIDGGSISNDELDIPHLRLSWGVGGRIRIGGNRLPITLGVGFPINPERKDDERRFFISMGGQF